MTVRKPKPPSVRSVSATLRAAGFDAYIAPRDEGYKVEWSQMPGTSPVRVSYESVTREQCELAMRAMTVVLQRKGWDVRDVGYLLVKGS